MGIPRPLLVAAAGAALWLGSPSVISAQSAENVAVVVNENSEASKRIAEHYVKVRNIPASNVFKIETSTEETIERHVYLKTIEQPLSLAIASAGLQDRILYIVLTKGVPLRIAGTTGLNGTQSSVDSELTLLYRRMVGELAPTQGKIDNPYFLGDRLISDAWPFTHRQHDIYLVTRLDAYTVESVLELIDRAQHPATDGDIVLDQRGVVGNGRQWLDRTVARLGQQGEQARVALVVSEESKADKEPVIGYYYARLTDMGSHDRIRFVAGSVAVNLASFDARTFQQPPHEWSPTASSDRSKWFAGSGEGLIADLIGQGVTGVSGQVAEPYLMGAMRPEILFPAYLAGFNLAEAFYLAMPTLSWQTVVVGDPLCAPFGRTMFARAQLEDSTDAMTGLPASFANRRLLYLRDANPDLPRETIPLVAKFQVLLLRDDRAAARRALGEALALAPRATSLLVNAAQLEEKDGEYEDAIASYREVLKLEPANLIALNNLAYDLAQHRKSASEALPYAQRAASLAPHSGAVLDTLGWIQHLLGNHDAAVSLLRQAMRFEPARGEIRLHAALAYAASDKTDRAEAELKEALRLDPALEMRTEVREVREQLESSKHKPTTPH